VTVILVFFVLHWYLSLFSQTFFLHRYSAHKMFLMNKFWERFFYFFTYVTQGSSYLSPRAYAILHRMHHAYSDTEKDPHTPHHTKNVFTMMMKTKDIYNGFVNDKVTPEARFDGNVPVWRTLESIGDSWYSRAGWGTAYVLFYIYFVPASAWYLFLLLIRFGDGIRRNAGTVSHFGLALMLIGILFSAGYDKVVSLNRSGRIYNKSFSTEMTRDNVLMWRGKPMKMDGYNVLYQGPRTELAEPFALVDSDSLRKVGEGYKALALGTLTYQGKVYAKKGDTVAIRPENTYYQIVCRDTATKEEFVLYPRAQANPSMGLLASPDIRTTAGFDLYTHISSIPSPEQKEEDHPELQRTMASPGKVFFANDFVCKIIEVRPVTQIDELPGTTFDAGVETVIEVQGPGRNYKARPKYLIKGNEAGRLYSDINDLGIRFEIVSIDPVKGIFEIGYHATQQDWIILKAVQKPFMALVWGGFLVMIGGFFLALADRQMAKEPSRTSRRKRAAHA